MFTHTHSSSVSSTITNNSFLSFFLSIPPPPRAMYTNYNITFSCATDSLNHFPSPPEATTAPPMEYSTTPQVQHHYQLTLRDYDSVSQLNSDQISCNAASNYYNSCSSGCTSYMGSPSSLASYESQRVSSRFMQRSVSSHTLRKNNWTHHNYPVSSLFADLLDSENGPVRRVYSTGDLQRTNGMQHCHQSSESSLSSESSMIIEGMSRTSPYSPEEKKARIERYRTKRNQRNFNKKIKYACRKTLADSRPRIRGRFARNDEIVMNLPVSTGEEEDEEDHENWDNFFDSLVSANLVQEPQVFY